MSVEIAVRRSGAVATQDFVIWLFCLVDDRLNCRHKHPQAQLWPSELVTIGLLFALKGGSFRSFYRWLERDYAELLVGCPSARACCGPCASSSTRPRGSSPTRRSSP